MGKVLNFVGIVRNKLNKRLTEHPNYYENGLHVQKELWHNCKEEDWKDNKGCLVRQLVKSITESAEK